MLFLFTLKHNTIEDEYTYHKSSWDNYTFYTGVVTVTIDAEFGAIYDRDHL